MRLRKMAARALSAPRRKLALPILQTSFVSFQRRGFAWLDGQQRLLAEVGSISMVQETRLEMAVAAEAPVTPSEAEV